MNEIDQPFQITSSLPSAYHPAAVALYLQAFQAKLAPVFGTFEQAARFLMPGFQPDRSFVAMRGSDVLGIAGFRHEGRGVFHRKPGDFLREYGWSSPFRLLLLSIIERAEEPNLLLMDGIAVSEAVRGQGVGTALLSAISGHARHLGKKGVRLDVVNTNPRARKLYEREGFIAKETIDVWPLSYIFPFQATTWMVKPA